MLMRDLRSIDDELGNLDPRGTLARLGASAASRMSMADFDAALSAIGAPIERVAGLVADAEVVTSGLGSEGSESLADLFDDVGSPSAENRPISVGAPAASFLTSSSDASVMTSLEDLLDAPGGTGSVEVDVAADVSAEADQDSDEPEIEIEEDEFAALDSLEIVVDD